MVIELVKGVALLLALSLMQSVNIRFWRKHNIAGQVSAGILFGAICVAGMMMPIVVAPGVISIPAPSFSAWQACLVARWWAGWQR